MDAVQSVVSLLADHLSFRTALVLLLVLIATLRYFRKPRNLPPMPPAWPIVGHIPALATGHRRLTMNEWAKTYGPVYRMRIRKAMTVVISGYDVIHEALVTRAEDFSSRPLAEGINPKQLGIAFAPFGPAWKEHRKFTLRSLRQFGFGKRSLEGKILEESTALQAEIMKLGDRPFDIRRMLQNAVTNVTCSIVFGSRWDYQDEKSIRLLVALNKFVSLSFVELMAMAIRPILRFVPALQGPGQQGAIDLKSYIKEEIDFHKMTFDASDIRDLIDSYLKEMKSRENESATTFTEENVQMVMFDLFIAGAETTSTTLYWAFLYMILNPDIQGKVQEEIHSVLGFDKPPSTAHRAQMPYTEAVLTEVSRIGSILPHAITRLTTRDTTFRGYHIPKGTVVVPNLWSVHHDPDHFPNPDKFDPGRFLDAQGQYRRDDHVIPFSLGPRMCLGKQLAEMELFLFFTSLLQHFTFKLPEGADRPSTTGVHGLSHSPNKFELVCEPLA